jgi:ATP-dependent Clp protease ATP-binding subunit ClpA
MFERFTSESRRVVVLAQEEARNLNHNYIGTEHLLLGLLHEGKGAAAKALTSMDVTLEAARRDVEVHIGRGKKAPSGHIPFTPPAKKCLELSLREALQFRHRYIGTGHILLGLITEGDDAATQILGRLGADLDRLRARVIVELENDPEGEGGIGESVRVAMRPRDDPIRDLLDSISDRLSSIERRLGITRSVPAEGASPAEGTVSEAVGRLAGPEEVARLRALLRRHGIDPGEPGDPAEPGDPGAAAG